MTAWVSICIPTYQAESTVAETISSVISQTHTDWELVIVDDASSDATVEVAKSFDDPRIRVEAEPVNLGLTGNSERACSHAQYDYVKLVGADDLIYPEAVAKQLAILESHPTVSLTSARRDIVDGDGEIIAPNRGLNRRLTGIVDGRKAVHAIVASGYNPIGEPVCTMFRASAKQAAGPFSEKHISPMDMDMWVRLLRHGDFYGSTETLSAWRLHASSHTGQNHRKYGRADRALFQEIADDPHWAIGRRTLGSGIVRSHLNSLHRSLRLKRLSRRG